MGTAFKDNTSPPQGGGLRLELLYGEGHASVPIWSTASCRPCPALLQAGPSACWPQAPVLSRFFSSPALPNVKLCQLPELPRGASKTLLAGKRGLQWQGMFCPPAGPGIATQEIHSDLPHLPRAGPILACLCPTLLWEIDSFKVQIVLSLAVTL